MRYDLHMHTSCSDGTMDVQEVLRLAKGKGLSGVSITDHDTLGAYPQAFEEGAKLKLKVLSGIEISCLHQGQSVHVLGYAFSYKNGNFNAFIKHCQEMRELRNLQMLENLKQFYQIDIKKEVLVEKFQKPLASMGRPHIAQILIDLGQVNSIQSAFNRYLGDKQKCYVKGHRPSVIEAIDLLHQAKAFAILAHPHLIDSSPLVKELLTLPFDGLEGYYAKFMPEQEQKWVDKAKEKNWIITGGSDFHGYPKAINELGSSWVDENTFGILMKRQMENESLSIY